MTEREFTEHEMRHVECMGKICNAHKAQPEPQERR